MAKPSSRLDVEAVMAKSSSALGVEAVPNSGSNSNWSSGCETRGLLILWAKCVTKELGGGGVGGHCWGGTGGGCSVCKIALEV